MLSFILKLIICPLVIYVSDILIPQINFATINQIIIVGVVLAVVSYFMDLLILRRGTFWISNLMDFLGVFLVVYLSQFFVRNTSISVIGALFISVLFLIIEYFVHLYLIRHERVGHVVRTTR